MINEAYWVDGLNETPKKNDDVFLGDSYGDDMIEDFDDSYEVDVSTITNLYDEKNLECFDEDYMVEDSYDEDSYDF